MTELIAFSPEKHYETICIWWGSYDWPNVPLSHLPPTGLVVEADGSPVCAGFIYFTQSAFCLFEWIVADKAAEKATRTEALDKLIIGAKDLCKVNGVSSIFTSVRNVGFVWRLEKHGFKVTDKGMTNLIGAI